MFEVILWILAVGAAIYATYTLIRLRRGAPDGPGASGGTPTTPEGSGGSRDRSDEDRVDIPSVE